MENAELVLVNVFINLCINTESIIFLFDILVENIEDIRTAKLLEIEYIEKYCTFTKGYNSTLGGTGGDMSAHETYKIAIKNIMKIEKNLHMQLMV